MPVVVGFQWAAPPKEATVEEDGTIGWVGARRIVGASDRVAIELAAELARASDDRVVGVCVSDAEQAVPAASGAGIACGLDEAVLVALPTEPDTAEAAAALAEQVRELGDVPAVVVGDCSADSGTRMLAPLLGGLLGWPVLTSVTDAGFEDDGLRVVAEPHGGPQRFRVTGPVVLSTTPDARTPRQLGLRDILGAGAKPARTVHATPAALFGTVEVQTRSRTTLGRRAGRVVQETDPARAAAVLVAELMARGAL